jgi:hypothetical protein
VAAKRNPYELQAVSSVILGVVGGLCTLAGLFFVLQKFDFTSLVVIYSPRSMRLPAIAGTLFVGLIAGGVGLLLGFLSAGERLNKRSRLSWTGFFLSAAVVALALSCGIFFWITKFAEPVREAVDLGG